MNDRTSAARRRTVARSCSRRRGLRRRGHDGARRAAASARAATPSASASAAAPALPVRRRPAISTSCSSRRRSTTRTSTPRRRAPRRRPTELGGQFKQIGSQNATAAEQIPFIQDATTQGYKAIVVSATGADEVAPALKAAKDAGIKVVGYDSSPAEGAYDVFVNQTDFSLIGGSMAQWACDLAPDCSGEIAILSATATATNQNAWIEDFNKALSTDPKFAKLKLVDTVYGDDDATKSTNEANGLLQKYPDLKVIVAPTTVGILAAAQVVKQAGSAVKVTGLGLPNDMKAFVADGTTPKFGLWSVPDLGYLAYYVAAKLDHRRDHRRARRDVQRPRPQRRPAVHDRREVRGHPRPAVRVQHGQHRPVQLLGGSSSAADAEAPGHPLPGPHPFRRADDAAHRVRHAAPARAPRPSTAVATPRSGPRCSPSSGRRAPRTIRSSCTASDLFGYLEVDDLDALPGLHGRQRRQRPLAGRHGRRSSTR